MVATSRDAERARKRERQERLASAAAGSTETRTSNRSSTWTRTTSALVGSGLCIGLEVDKCYIHKLWRTRTPDGKGQRVATHLSMPLWLLDCLMAARYVLRRYEVDGLKRRAAACPHLESVAAAGAAYDEMITSEVTSRHFDHQARLPWRREGQRTEAEWRGVKGRLGRLHEDLLGFVTAGKLPAVDAWQDRPGGLDAAMLRFVARWGLEFAREFYGPTAADRAIPDCWREDTPLGLC